MEFRPLKNTYNIPGIELLPHRPPFLFVDNLIAADETGALGEYTFTMEKNDFFKGHFPDFPIVPGVVLIETMAQVHGAGLIATKFLGENASFLFAKVEEAKFKRPVRPGDKLTVFSEAVKVKKLGHDKGIGVFAAKGYVGDELAVEGTLTCMLGGTN
ncbi:MAG: beta-hydroxyacyl-ACP dehydratase [Kiritimatiellae bacterium]|nr:beta-hydroxyacyl-ACP dehydratase [Kiritimatiellia bacterium]